MKRNPLKPPPMTPLEMQQTTEEIMRELGVSISMALKEYFPASGFTLLVFPFNKPKRCNYISNAERNSMIKALKEAARRLEQNEDMPSTPGAIH